MLDFDFVCRREEPSVACLVYPFTGDHKLKFYWGHKEVLIPGKSMLLHFSFLFLMELFINTKIDGAFCSFSTQFTREWTTQWPNIMKLMSLLTSPHSVLLMIAPLKPLNFHR